MKDDYQRVTVGEKCPRCGEPARRRDRVTGSTYQVWMVHATTGHGQGGCIIEEGIIVAGDRRKFG